MIMMTVMVVINMISNSHYSGLHNLHTLQRIRCKNRYLPPGAWSPKTQDMAKISATFPSLPQYIGAIPSQPLLRFRPHPWPMIYMSVCLKTRSFRFITIQCLTCLYFLNKAHQFKPADNSHPHQEISSSNPWFSGARGHLLVLWQGVYELYPFSSRRKRPHFSNANLWVANRISPGRVTKLEEGHRRIEICSIGTVQCQGKEHSQGKDIFENLRWSTSMMCFMALKSTCRPTPFPPRATYILPHPPEIASLREANGYISL